jgi:serine/threonine-protein kinase PknG
VSANVVCGRPGCSGVIDDGCCAECGRPPVTAAPPAAASGPATAAAGPPTAAAPPTATGPPTAAAPPTAAGSRPLSPSTRRPPGTRQAGAKRSGGRSGRGVATTTSTGSGRGRLGAGLVDVPAVPRVDPVAALLTDPQVPEDRRFCRKCGHPVGRAHGDRPGRAEGVCPEDGERFSFRPKLAPGTLVAGQYEVRGCLAHGGLGWIYLATDRNVDNRWVVLKGLLDADAPEAAGLVDVEKRFLATVDHPGIVSIHNFVEHHDRAGNLMGFIVMEYVGGSSLKQIMEARRRDDGTLEPLPVPQAIAYALEVLPALGYLHGQGLAYCDFKPDNVIQYDRQLKLIDLGAVIRFDDEQSPVYGTVGFQAPEIATHGPSPASDIYTVGRTLAVLALGSAPVRDGAPTPLPDDHPVLVRYESFHRLLLRATDPDPDGRFGSTDEFAEQLAGVLREVLALEDGQARPAMSTVFSAPRGAFAADLLGATRPGHPDPARVAAVLPMPLVDPADPAAAQLAAASPQQVRKLAATMAQPGPEVRLALARAELTAGDPAAALVELDALAAEDAGDWRIDWYRGIAALFTAPAPAVAAFDRAYSTFPGEQGPKLALAVAAECARDDDRARRYYALLARIEPSLADAAFGLARTALRAGDRAVAVAALDAVPDTSSRHVAAQLAAIDATLAGRSGTEIGDAELRAAAARLPGLALHPAIAEQVRTALLTAAVELVAGNGNVNGTPIMGHPWRERDLRLALERSVRTSARLTSDMAERVALVDRANAARPRTWT